MNRTRAALLALFTLVALLAVAPVAGAKTIAAAPDLVVKKVSKLPATVTVGSKVKMTVTVRNTGNVKAGKSKLGLYLGKGKKHTKKDKRLKRVKVKPLAAGKSKKLKLRVVLPAKTKLGSYRLFACADDTKKVKEAKERNCRATRKVRLLAKAVAPTPPPAPAFTMSDGIDWGFVQNAEEKTPAAGEPITLTLSAANGIPGQAGYARSSVPSEGFRNGVTTTLSFSEADDDQATLPLPFAFPFGGVREQTISVSTNGWVSFGSPAWDYWDDSQPGDYRGIQAVVGEFDRGLMPYWADLTLEEGSETGAIKQVVAPDSSWVAFQWDVFPLGGGTAARRTFQLVLFPDGRFRFDYPGENKAGGGAKSLTGYSLGTGAPSADIVSAEGEAVPPSGLLFTPNALPAAGGAAAGQMTATLPKGSTFSSAPGCALTTAPGPFNTGLVSCPVAGLAPGEQTSRAVTFLVPPNAPGQTRPANFRLLGSYLSGGLQLNDGDEIDLFTTDLRPAAIDIDPEFATSPLEVGMAETIDVEIASTTGGLDEPTVSFELAKAAFSAIEIAGQPIECTAPSGNIRVCSLPSGVTSTTVEVTVIPSAPSLEMKIAAQALNAPLSTLGVGFIG